MTKVPPGSRRSPPVRRDRSRQAATDRNAPLPGSPDMKTVLVAYASRMGSTQEIAAAIGDQLTSRGFEVEVVAAADAPKRPDLRCRHSRQCPVHGALGKGRRGLPETPGTGPDRPSDLAVPERTVRTSRRGYSPPRRHAPSGVCATRSVSPPPRPSGGTSTIPAPRACSRDGCPTATSPATSETGTRSGPGPMTSPTSSWPSAHPPAPDGRRRRL